MDKEYFETEEEVAKFLNMSLEEFLRLRIRGKIGFLPRPKDPQQVYFKSDIEKWIADGKPVERVGGIK